MRTLLFSVLLSVGLAIAGTQTANAADGCGPDRHYSHWRGGCVWDPAPYRAYGYNGYYAPPAAYAPPVYYGATRDVYYGPPPSDYYIDPSGYYASTVIHNTPRGRYFDLWYY